jgi:hypothetical protein
MIQDVATDLGLESPTTVIGNLDPTIITLLSLSNREGRELSSRFDWNALIEEATFSTTPSVNLQGTLVSVAGAGFEAIINGTFWDRTHTRPIRGSISRQRWAQMEASTVAGPFSEYMIRDKSIYAIPVPSTATWAFFYKSGYWNTDSTGVTGQRRWAVDSDVGVIDENIMGLGIEWRYLKSKGFDYSEEFMTYERRIQTAINQDRGHPMINLQTSRIGGPGVLGVPEGSWPAV